MKKVSLFEFEDRYDNQIDKSIKKQVKDFKVSVISKRHIKSILGVKGLLDNNNLSQDIIDNTVNKFVELYTKYKSFTKVIANWDGEAEKENGKYKNQAEVEKAIAILNFYKFRDTHCEDERAGIERDRIFKIRQREAVREVPAIYTALAMLFLVFIFIKYLYKGA